MQVQNALAAYAAELGFSHIGPLDIQALEFLPEVRAMCAADRCQCYGSCWTCPPGCGTLEEHRARAGQYRQGLLVQSTGPLEDDFDLASMQACEQAHRARFLDLAGRARAVAPGCLPLGAGPCLVCPACTYPDAPCRFPERAIPSMEAYGLLVWKVCQQSGLGYYYGRHTITYTSCVLF